MQGFFLFSKYDSGAMLVNKLTLQLLSFHFIKT